MKHFEWMVFNKVTREGIWFRGTLTGFKYVFYWNPIKTLRLLFSGDAYFGFFPLSVKHIKWK